MTSGHTTAGIRAHNGRVWRCRAFHFVPAAALRFAPRGRALLCQRGVGWLRCAQLSLARSIDATARRGGVAHDVLIRRGPSGAVQSCCGACPVLSPPKRTCMAEPKSLSQLSTVQHAIASSDQQHQTKKFSLRSRRYNFTSEFSHARPSAPSARATSTALQASIWLPASASAFWGTSASKGVRRRLHGTAHSSVLTGWTRRRSGLHGLVLGVQLRAARHQRREGGVPSRVPGARRHSVQQARERRVAAVHWERARLHSRPSSGAPSFLQPHERNICCASSRFTLRLRR